MTPPAAARGPEATFVGRVLIAAGVVLAAVTAGADLLKARWELGPLQMAGLGVGAASVVLGIAALRLPVAGVLSIGLMAGATLPAWATGGQQSAPPPPPSPPVITAVVPAPSSPPRAKTPAPRAQNPRAASPATAPTSRFVIA